MENKVLLLGADPQAVGGVSTVNRTILESRYIQDRYTVNMLSTWNGSNWILEFMKSIFRLLIIRDKYDLFHVDVSVKGSCIRKIILTKFLKGRKYIVQIHSGGFLDYYNSCNSLIKKQIRKMLLNARMVCCVSNTFVQPIIDNIGLPDNRVTYVYNGVDIKEKPVTKNNKVLQVLYMGKLIKNRGIEDYLDIASHYIDDDNINFLVAGDGKQYDWDTYNVQYLGVIKGEKKDAILDNADILINGVYYESFGISMVECMNHCMCIIGRRAGSIPEILENGNSGYIYSSINEAIDVIDMLNNDRIKLQEMQAQAYMRSLDFPMKRFYESIVRLYEACI